jgi:hypothetical protein
MKKKRLMRKGQPLVDWMYEKESNEEGLIETNENREKIVDNALREVSEFIMLKGE